MKKRHATTPDAPPAKPARVTPGVAEPAAPRMTLLERLFLWVLTLGVVIFLGWAVTRYDATQYNSEVAQRMLPSVLANGNGFVFKDLLKSFDFPTSDQMSRARFVSYAVQIVNIKLRIWLWRYLPPHPSISIVWLCVLVLTPLYLYKFVRILSGTARVAWMAVLLFAVSAGSLSGALQLFHPGKPLANLWTVLCLYLAARIDQGMRQSGRLGAALRVRFAGMLLVMLVACFTDELGFFIPVAIPLLVPGLLFRRPASWRWRELLRVRWVRWPLAVAYLLPAVLFVILVNKVLPDFTAKLGYMGYDFWAAIRDRDGGGHLDWRSFLAGCSQNGFHMVANHIMPLRQHSEELYFSGPPIQNFFSVDVYVYLLWAVYLFRVGRNAAARERGLLLRVVWVLPLFLIFSTRLFSGAPCGFAPFYYGATFSVYFSLFVALLLAVRVGWHGWLNQGLTAALLVLFAANAWATNRVTNAHIDSNYRAVFGQNVADMPKENRVTYDKVERVWRSRRDRKIVDLADKRDLPARAFWLFVELDRLP